jgi:hypothetical protein
MGQCQVDNKSSAKMVYFSQGDVDILVTEFTLNLFCVAALQEQGLPHIDHDIKGKLAIGRHQSAELFALERRLTTGTNDNRDVGLKLADGQ